MTRVCLHDPEVIARTLFRQPDLNLYKIGDLADFFWPHTQWFGWQGEEGIEAVALLYCGDELPVLLLMEDTPAAQCLLTDLAPLLPARFYAHLRPQLEQCLPFSGVGGDIYLRMVQRQVAMDFDAPLVTLQAQRPDLTPRLLDPADAERLQAFYGQHYPQNWFNPRMLATRSYCALETSTQEIVAVAGVHVISEAHAIAALGNIAVHLAHRGQNLGYWVTAFLCQHLRQHLGIQVLGLNVHQDNQKAQACYKRLGFDNVATYQEWTFSQV